MLKDIEIWKIQKNEIWKTQKNTEIKAVAKGRLVPCLDASAKLAAPAVEGHRNLKYEKHKKRREIWKTTKSTEFDIWKYKRYTHGLSFI